MGGLLDRARRWWPRTQRAPAAVPYEVACSCGRVAQGLRREQFQSVPCAGCGKALFVLPLTPYHPSEHGKKDVPVIPAASPAPWSFIRRPWGLPILAAVLTVVLVVLAYALILWHWGREGAPSRSEPPVEAQLRAHLQAGEEALNEARFGDAVGEFEQARGLRDRHPELLSPASGRQLNQLHREAALLDSLLHSSLQEILHKAALERHENQWQTQFRSNYLDRAVIFDDVVRREPDGRCLLSVYEVRVNDVPVRLELGELALLQVLPLERPQRLLFGARLASVAREPPGVWVIRFRPDSGVLLTHEEAAAACSPLPLDEDLRQVLRRQAEWTAGLP